ncbi:MAG: alpha/beta hydrolase-fold protein [Bacteroidales bacterium]|jgi:predicted alpha/beta superfamily hydrolase|nr:alpha/beta hydrolase-fold protein [Bacteroidales bacterium]
MKINLLLFFIFFSKIVFSQVDFIINTLSHDNSSDDSIFIAGNFNSWRPHDLNYVLDVNKDGFYHIVMSLNGTIEFKFTRGSWHTVEKNAEGNDISNRTFTFSEDTVAYFNVSAWAESADSNEHTTVENLTIIDKDFYIPQLNRNRKISLYLPPDYNKLEKYYPVLYMHDGQNLFDILSSFAGEWQVDESLNEISSQGINVPIVVGINNGGSDRIDELTPWENSKYGGGDGEKYMQFIVETLKPYIDSNFRTLPDRKNTALMGSSLGGLISFYGGLKYQEVFSKIGVFSPSFWFSDTVYNFASENEKLYESRIYFLASMNEGENQSTVKNMQAIYDTLLNNFYTERDMKIVTPSDGEHNESFWRREFISAYIWLFSDNYSYIKKN